MSKVFQKDQSGGARKYLMFSLQQEKFVVPLAQVREVVALHTVTPVPNAPRHHAGLMNLRGKIVSLIHLKGPLGVAESAASAKRPPCVIVCEVGQGSWGAVVDEVNEVISVDSSALETEETMQSKAVLRPSVIGVVKLPSKSLALVVDFPKLLEGELGHEARAS
jgi:purine-binding chemotaxis protein CheW